MGRSSTLLPSVTAATIYPLLSAQLLFQVQQSVHSELYSDPPPELQEDLERIQPPRNFTAMPGDGNTRCRAVQTKPAYLLAHLQHFALHPDDYALEPLMAPQRAAMHDKTRTLR